MIKIPFNKLGPDESFDAESARQAVVGALYSGRYLFGEQTKRFETEFSELARAGFSFEDMLLNKNNGDFKTVTVANGTDALTIMLMSSLPPGSLVAVTPIAPPAVLTGILHAGMNIVYCDVEPSGLISIDSLYALHDKYELDGVLAVHLYGQLCDMKALNDFSVATGIKIFEDAAQAMWSRRDDYGVGKYSSAAAFSFYPTKTLGAVGDAGAIIFKDITAAHNARFLKFYNVSDEVNLVQGSYHCGFNSRMDELQAAFLRSQFQHSYELTECRKTWAKMYQVRLKKEIQHRKDVGNAHIFTVVTEDRDFVHTELEKRGIGTKIHYPTPLHKQPCYEPLFNEPCPAANELVSKVLSLPLYPHMSVDDFESVVQNVNEVCHNAS